RVRGHEHLGYRGLTTEKKLERSSKVSFQTAEENQGHNEECAEKLTSVQSRHSQKDNFTMYFVPE
ncbi:hypothetical protein TNIN_54001, partial [Trichonephila inaurata madagascariensis]